MSKSDSHKPVIGWRESVLLQSFSPIPINAKIDTGARTSALHAFNLSVGDVDGVPTAMFTLHPVQRSHAGAVRVSAPLIGYRKVRSSDGRAEVRPTIRTPARIGGEAWNIEMTLTSRDEMGFRMLLGRSAVRNRFVIDPGKSYLLSHKPPKSGKA